MSASKSHTPIMSQSQVTAARMATITAEVENMRSSLDSIDKRMGEVEKENRDSFNRVYDKLDKATAPRPTPWNLILTAAGVAIAFATALSGGILTLLLALAVWANAYFSEMISKTELKAETAVQANNSIFQSIQNLQTNVASQASRLDAVDRRAENRADERLPASPVRN